MYSSICTIILIAKINVTVQSNGNEKFYLFTTDRPRLYKRSMKIKSSVKIDPAIPKITRNKRGLAGKHFITSFLFRY